MVETKPFGISKRAVWEAYRRVKEPEVRPVLTTNRWRILEKT